MLSEIRKSFKDGEINKQEFISRMFGMHSKLNEYSQYIKGSHIKEIQINGDEVVFTLEIQGELIKFVHSEKDMFDIALCFLNFGAYEEDEFAMIMQLARQSKVVFDIGANKGWYSINILKAMKDIAVHSFEPIPSNFNNMIRNFEINGLDYTNVHKLGLYKENAILDFCFDEEYTVASSLVDLRQSCAIEHVKCEVQRLDDFVERMGIDGVDLIKCDVEGSELFVFQGAIETLKRFSPMVFSEMLRKWSRRFEYHPNDIIELFRSINYGCYTINGPRIRKFDLVTEDTTETNYLFFHKDKHDRIIRDLLE